MNSNCLYSFAVGKDLLLGVTWWLEIEKFLPAFDDFLDHDEHS